LSGSADLYGDDGRRPFASVNFVTVHDGFTLADLVTYEHKHNEANLEGNADGTDQNDSWNCGLEGPTDDAQIDALRRRQVRNLLVMLFLSQGVPLLQAGDEIGRTQRGNNNAFCQDGDLTWLDWDLDAERQALLAFIRRVIRLRADEPVFRRRTFFQGRPITGDTVKDVYWLNPAGREMRQEDWATPQSCLGVLLVGNEIGDLDGDGNRITGGTFLLLFNATDATADFLLPERLARLDSSVLLDTGSSSEDGGPVEDSYQLFPHSSAVLRVEPRPEPRL
jgi:glycogen operon protein